MLLAENIWFYGNELKGVHSGWRTVRLLKEGRKWVTVEINRKRYRVAKGVWGQWPRYQGPPTGSDPGPRACKTKRVKRRAG